SFPYTSRGAVQPVGAANAAANAKRATADPANFFLCNTRTSLQSPGLPGMLAGVFAKHEHKTIGFAQTRRCVRHQGALVLRPAQQVAPANELETALLEIAHGVRLFDAVESPGIGA